jgi:predicted DNA-binding protein (MmcQ/YjbR family)
MEFEAYKKYLFNLPESRLEFPQGPDTLVYKIMGKPFAYISWQSTPIFISLKCQPSKAIELRNQIPGIMPGYHGNRNNWISIYLNNEYISDELFLQWTDSSYELAVQEMPGFLRKRALKKIEAAKQDK